MMFWDLRQFGRRKALCLHYFSMAYPYEWTEFGQLVANDSRSLLSQGRRNFGLRVAGQLGGILK